MRILTFPHCGRQFECGDTVNIVDIRQAQNAFAFALQYGDLQVNAYTRAWNATDALYLGTFPDGEFITMYDEAVCGFPSRLLFAKSPNAYLQRFPVEIVDSYDSAAITLGFRFMDISEAATIAGGSTGQGARGQRIRVQLVNIPNAQATNVVDIYYDRAWYLTNVGTPGGVNWIDLSNQTASPGYSAGGLVQDGHNILSVIHSLPASFRQINRAAAGYLLISYEFPRNSNGTAWQFLPATESAEITYKPHPLTGDRMAFSGINEVQCRFYRTDDWVQGTATPTATNSRAYPILPLPAWPSMGDAYTAGVHIGLNARMNAIKGIGYIAASASGSNRGGIMRPLVGDSFRFNEQTLQALTFYGEIPNGATQWMLLAYVKTDNHGGSNQTLRFRVNANGFDTLSTTSHTSSGSNLARWHYATGTLSGFTQPTNGKVNRMDIIIESEKSAPIANRIEAPTYWDGVHSFFLKVF